MASVPLLVVSAAILHPGQMKKQQLTPLSRTLGHTVQCIIDLRCLLMCFIPYPLVVFDKELLSLLRQVLSELAHLVDHAKKVRDIAWYWNLPDGCHLH